MDQKMVQSKSSDVVQDIMAFDNQEDTFVEKCDGGALSQSILGYKDTSDGLINFLKRPALISTIVWTAAQTAGTSLAVLVPFYDLINQTQYKDKLKNFSSYRADVRLRFLINGTPFHYGRVICSDLPYSGLVPSSVTDRITKTSFNIGGGAYQCNHITLEPTVNNSKDWILPMVTPLDTIPLQFAGSNYNSISMHKIYILVDDVLKSANAGTADPITIQVLANFENIILGPITPEIVVQGPKEDTSKGVISSIATSVASTARFLKDVPIIGRFMRATDVAATAVSSIATMFGYSNPTIADRYTVVKAQPMTNISHVIGRDSGSKITMDPLQQVTVSPSDIGFCNEDEMSYASLYKRPILLRRITWNTASDAGTSLAMFDVTPALCPRTGGALPFRWSPGPINLLSLTHKLWSGALKYRIEVICSAFHKGRLAIRYNPHRVSSTNPGFGEPTASTLIIDIAEKTSVDFTIGWSQSNLWAYTNALVNSLTDPSSSPLTTMPYSNGTFSIEIYTELTAPQTVAPVTVLVFVEGSESLRFAEPSSTQLRAVTVQATSSLGTSMKSLESESAKSYTLGGPSQFCQNLTKITQGEEFFSIRSFLKRPIPYAAIYNGNFGNQTIPFIIGFRIPYLYFRSTSGTYPDISYVHPIDLWRTSFAAQKGSVRHKLIPTGSLNRNIKNCYMAKTENLFDQATDCPMEAKTAATFTSDMSFFGSGIAYKDLEHEFLEFEINDYQTSKFTPTLMILNNANGPGPRCRAIEINVEAPAGDYTTPGRFGYLDLFSIGEDYSLFHFFCCPELSQGSFFTSVMTGDGS